MHKPITYIYVLSDCRRPREGNKYTGSRGTWREVILDIVIRAFCSHRILWWVGLLFHFPDECGEAL